MFTECVAAYWEVCHVCFAFLGGRTADEIVVWLNKKTGPPAKSIDSSEDVKKFIDDKDVAVVGFFTDVESAEAKAYIESADGIDDVEFAIVSSAEIAKEYEVEGNGIVLFKKVCSHMHCEN